jgi:hypothetical protein
LHLLVDARRTEEEEKKKEKKKEQEQEQERTSAESISKTRTQKKRTHDKMRPPDPATRLTVLGGEGGWRGARWGGRERGTCGQGVMVGRPFAFLGMNMWAKPPVSMQQEAVLSAEVCSEGDGALSLTLNPNPNP